MNDVSKSRKERLRACERALAEHMEEFVKVGMALKEIRDDRLYKEDGWTDFDEYTREKWGWGRSYVDKTIGSAELRLALPEPPKKVGTTGPDSDDGATAEGWKERQVRELKRLESPTKAKAVASRVIKEVEASSGGVKLTASLVRKHVDRELKVDRKPKQKEGPTFKEVIFQYVGEVNGMVAVIEEVPEDALLEWGEDNPAAAKDFAEAVARLQKVWEVTRPAPTPQRRILEVQ